MENKDIKKYVGVLSILAFFITLFLTRNRIGPYLIKDELGPIAVAAYFNGNDLSEMIQYMAYYSYGISIFLTPLMYFFDDPISFYRAGVILNCIFIPIQLILLYKIFNTKLKNDNSKILALSCFAFVMCTPNIVRAGIVVGETLLTLFFIITIFLLIKLKENSKIIASLFGFALAFMYVIHQRNIGIVIAGLIVVAYMVYKKDLSKKNLAIFISVFVVSLFIHSHIKDYIKEVVWLNSITSQRNDFNGVASLLESLTSRNGLFGIIQKALGAIFYFGATTFCMGYVGVYAISKKIYNHFKYKNDDNYKDIYFELYLILSFLALVGITGIYFANDAYNEDLISYYYYGRYVFFSFIPLAIYGINSINEISDRKTSVFIQGLFVALTLFVINGVEGNGFSYQASIYLGVFYRNGRMDYLLIIFVTLVMFNIIIAFYSKKNRTQLISLACISGVYIFTAPFTISIANKFVQDNDYSEIVNEIKNDEDKSKVYVQKDEFTMFMQQYQMFDQPLYPLKTDDFYTIENNEYLISRYLDNYLIEKFELKAEQHKNMLLKEGSGLGSINTLGISQSLIDDVTYTSDGQGGTLIYGPYLSIGSGAYNIEVSVEQYKDTDVEFIGTFDIAGVQNGESIIFDKQELNRADLVDGKYVYSTELLLPDIVNNLEIRFSVNENAYMKVNKVEIKDSDKKVVTKLNDDILKNYECIDTSQGAFIFEKSNSTNGVQLLDLCKSQIDEYNYKSENKAGALVYGPYISIEKGNYKVEVLVEQYSDSSVNEIGTFDIVGVQNGEQVVLDQKEISSNDLINGKYEYNAELELLEDVSDLEIRFFVNEDTYMQVDEVKLSAIE